MESIQNVLKDRSLNETQKILALAMFMDPKQCPNNKIDPEITKLGHIIKELVDQNKITLSFDKNFKLNVYIY